MKTKTERTVAPSMITCPLLVAAAVLALSCLPSRAGNMDDHGDRNRARHYRQVNLVSDLPGVAMLQDTNLVNAWGMSFSPTSPFWVNANGKGLAVLYAVTNDSSGKQIVQKLALEVTIPGEGNPTGQLFNNTAGFNGDPFIFASEDGTISGWRGALGTTAETLATRPTAVYKGIALATSGGEPLLLAANFAEGTLDVFDSDAKFVGQFSDSKAPAGYAPFNVQNLDGIIFVTFAKKETGGVDDVPGPGHGLIDIFNLRTGRFHRFATGSDAGGKLDEIDSPWGMAIAPGAFGKFTDQLLVGNFGNGTIMSFDIHGKFRGLLEDENDAPIAIEGLWGISVGNGGRAGSPRKLYFTAGPGEESHGLFGSLEPVMGRREH